jgi:hypothetical protein
MEAELRMQQDKNSERCQQRYCSAIRGRRMVLLSFALVCESDLGTDGEEVE